MAHVVQSPRGMRRFYALVSWTQETGIVSVSAVACPTLGLVPEDPYADAAGRETVASSAKLYLTHPGIQVLRFARPRPADAMTSARPTDAMSRAR